MSIISYDIETEDGDLIFKNGDLSIFDSNKEHATAIIDANKGEWKQYPTIGANLIKNINGAGITNRLQIEQQITKQLSDDGFNVQDLKVEYNLKLNKLNIKTNAQRFR
jgi:hypothetical protein